MVLRFRTLLLPAVTVLVATAILWGGVVLSKQVRIDRIASDGLALDAFAGSLQEELHSLESRYRDHLDALCHRDFANRFVLRDAIDAIVGVRQLSTLDLNGQVERHLLSSEVTEDEDEIPLPVFERDNLPVGRSRSFEIAGAPFLDKRDNDARGWVGAGEELFYYANVSERRTVFLLIDSDAVTASIESALTDSLREQMERTFPGQGSASLTLDGRAVATKGELSGLQPDVIRELGSRFGTWRILSRDPRREIVEYDTGTLVGATLLALFVALVGGFTSLHLHRTLRLAEQRVSFVNQVSHELKTPLTNILLNTDLALDGSDAFGRKRLAMVQEETRRLSRLIDNVLTYSRREHEPAPLASGDHDLGLLVEEVVSQFRPALERRNIQIRVESTNPGPTRVNPDAFSQILGNLLSNIEKYAASGGIAHLRLDRDGGETLLSIRDAGPGIPKSERERVFLPFHRLDDRTAEGASGTGLGLAIARDLARRMEGSLRLVPTDGGATFELRLPAGPESNVIEFPEVRVS